MTQLALRGVIGSAASVDSCPRFLSGYDNLAVHWSLRERTQPAQGNVPKGMGLASLRNSFCESRTSYWVMGAITNAFGGQVHHALQAAFSSRENMKHTYIYMYMYMYMYTFC